MICAHETSLCACLSHYVRVGLLLPSEAAYNVSRKRPMEDSTLESGKKSDTIFVRYSE